MRGNRFVDRGDPLPLGRVLGQPFQTAGRPELTAFGFEILEIEIGHAGAYGRIDAGGQSPAQLLADAAVTTGVKVMLITSL